MKRPNQVRAFILLDERETQFIRHLQRTVRKATGRKRHPSIRNIIQGVLMDYKKVMEFAASPDFLQAYEDSKKYRPPKGCSSTNDL